MTRESKPSIGADCHWSSPLPCGTPSTTSTITTVRASSFSATRCAVVAPTLPAPTTVILLTMLGSLGEEYERKLTEPGISCHPERAQRAMTAGNRPATANCGCSESLLLTSLL